MADYKTGAHSYEQAGSFSTNERWKITSSYGHVLYTDASGDKIIAANNGAYVDKGCPLFWTTKCSFQFSEA